MMVNKKKINLLRFNRLIADPRAVFLFSVLLVVVLFFFYRSATASQLVTYHQVVMDTSVELRFETRPGINPEELRDQVFSEMERLELIFSRSKLNSEISEINRRAGQTEVTTGPEMTELLTETFYYAEISEGSFDPTIAPLVDLWGFLGQHYHLPDQEELAEFLPLVDYSKVQFDQYDSTLKFAEQQMALELGGIAKGYIVDRALGLLIAAGIENAFINAGGDIATIGGRPDGTPWRIGIRHPRDSNRIIAVLPVMEGAVVTSGDYERFFEVNGTSYHHILDPKSGMPAAGLSSVTIMAETTTAADALSTAVFVSGPDQGLRIIERLPGVEGILITSGFDILVSSGLSGLVELNN